MTISAMNIEKSNNVNAKKQCIIASIIDRWLKPKFFVQEIPKVVIHCLYQQLKLLVVMQSSVDVLCLPSEIPHNSYIKSNELSNILGHYS